jgi:uncharacterized protein (TIGR03067 family)
MKRIAVVFSVFALTAAALAQNGDATRKDRDRFQGKWQLSAGKTGVIAVATPFVGGSMTFSGDKVTLQGSKNDTDPREGTYKIDATKKPAHIDLTFRKKGSDQAETLSGIYQFDEDTLRIGFVKDSSKGTRPTGFDLQNINTVVLILKRAKS